MREKLEFILTKRCDQKGEKKVIEGKWRSQKFFWVKGKPECVNCSSKGCLARGILYKVNGRKII